MKPIRHFTVYIDASFLTGEEGKGKLREIAAYLVPKSIPESDDITEVFRMLDDNYKKFRNNLYKLVLEE